MSGTTLPVNNQLKFSFIFLLLLFWGWASNLQEAGEIWALPKQTILVIDTSAEHSMSFKRNEHPNNKQQKWLRFLEILQGLNPKCTVPQQCHLYAIIEMKNSVCGGDPEMKGRSWEPHGFAH